MNDDARHPNERFVVFDCEGDSCVGVLCTPGAEASATAVLIVVGGPQYRAGSHRQFVLLARAIALAGMPALRFDYRGMGDSDGDERRFDAIDADIAAAIDAIVRETGAARIVLWGLCDGASAALMYAARDARVAGVIGVNPWAHTAQVEASARLRHYYGRRLLSRDFWRKLFAGKVDVKRSGDDLIGAVRTAAIAQPAGANDEYLRRMDDGWARLRRPMLLILSGNDLTAREFEAWIAADVRRGELVRRPACATAAIGDADHTFSSRAWRDAMTQCTLDWLRALR